jgi:hypothetical protein
VNGCRSDEFGQGNQIPVAGMNGTSQFTAEGVLLSRLSHAPLPSDEIRQLGGDVLSSPFNVSQLGRRQPAMGWICHDYSSLGS